MKNYQKQKKKLMNCQQIRVKYLEQLKDEEFKRELAELELEESKKLLKSIKLILKFYLKMFL